LNGLAEGFGVYTFKNQGVQYRGYFNGGVMHGNGVLIGLPSGQQREWLIYDGQWQRG
jgi:SLT domain-containing protein